MFREPPLWRAARCWSRSAKLKTETSPRSSPMNHYSRLFRSALQDVCDALQEQIFLERLDQHVLGPALQGVVDGLLARVPGQHDEGDLHLVPQQLAEQQPVLGLQRNVDDGDVRGAAREVLGAVAGKALDDV